MYIFRGVMTPLQETPRIYGTHRANQLERILEAAETLFIRDGVDNVSMEAIARAARITRKTLYQYFSNKMEIAMAVIQNILEKRAASFDFPQLPESTGFQRVEAFVRYLMNLLETHTEFFRFLVEFNTLYAREGNASCVRQMFIQGRERLVLMILQGKADGSIRSDVDPEIFSAALLNLISGMHSRFALLGDQIREEYGYVPMELYIEICRWFLLGIRNSSAPGEGSVMRK